MSDRSPEDQLTKYLTDVHSIEVQALAQLKAAPEIAGDERLAAAFAALFAAQPDTPAKLAGFAFAFEHLGSPPASCSAGSLSGPAIRTPRRLPTGSPAPGTRRST
jgi:hypothetical protein